MYITSILAYLAFPALIILTWWMVRLFLRIYEKKFGNREEAD